MTNSSFGDRSRLVIKNIPNSLDKKGLDELISKKCKEIGLQKCDVKLLYKQAKFKGGVKRLSRGICYVGFLSEKDATKFLNHYNNSYFNACKVSIEFSKAPEPAPKTASTLPRPCAANSTEGTKVIPQTGPRKAGVASQQIHITFDSDSDGAPETPEVAPNTKRPIPKAAPEATDAAAAVDMNRVVIFNLPYTVTEEMVRKLVNPFGKVEQIHIPLNNSDFTSPLDSQLNPTKGMCFVTFTLEADALKFVEEKNNSIFAGRIIATSLANTPKHQQEATAARPGKYYNRERNDISFEKFKKKRKQETDGAHIWNILHIDIAAAISAIASELQLDRAEILKDENAGVDAALSESYLLNKIKKWMKEQGINYDLSETKQEELHQDLLLIKNLPHNADDRELISLFGTCGKILKFATSPFKLLGLVQFSSKVECDRALRTLSYKMYKSLPLYLQKVSKRLLPTADQIAPISEDTIERLDGEKLSETAQLDEHEPATGDTNEAETEVNERHGHVSVYVSNIDPAVDEGELNKHFEGLEGFVISKIIKPLPDKSGGATESARPTYGFVEFDSVTNAKEAIKRKCGLVIAGRTINLELSKNKQTVSKRQRKSDGDDNEPKEVIVVKNLPFQANKKDVMELFSYYGNVKAVRIPKSASNTHRGFGFVEFGSKGDAKAAMENLGNVHLYGRRLVLQYVAG